MANISSAFNSYHIFQGPAVVYLGPSGATPSEIGGVFNVGIEVGMETERLEQGWPRILQQIYVKRKSAKVSFDSCETGDYPLVRYALGSATLVSATLGGGEQQHELYYGGQTTLNTCSIKLLIVNTENVTEEVSIWKALASDGYGKNYDDEATHKPTYQFEVMRVTQDWASNNMETYHGELMKMVITGNNIDATI